MQDCAALAWSLGKLAYRDGDLMHAVCDRYEAVCMSSEAQSIGTVSQMLKGATLQHCLTQRLLRLLQAQGAAALGSQERSAEVLQDVLDGCAVYFSVVYFPCILAEILYLAAEKQSRELYGHCSFLQHARYLTGAENVSTSTPTWIKPHSDISNITNVCRSTFSTALTASGFCDVVPISYSRLFGCERNNVCM